MEIPNYDSCEKSNNGFNTDTCRKTHLGCF